MSVGKIRMLDGLVFTHCSLITTRVYGCWSLATSSFLILSIHLVLGSRVHFQSVHSDRQICLDRFSPSNNHFYLNSLKPVTQKCSHGQTDRLGYIDKSRVGKNGKIIVFLLQWGSVTHQWPDGSTSPKYKLLCFITTKKFAKRRTL